MAFVGFLRQIYLMDRYIFVHVQCLYDFLNLVLCIYAILRIKENMCDKNIMQYYCIVHVLNLDENSHCIVQWSNEHSITTEINIKP